MTFSQPNDKCKLARVLSGSLFIALLIAPTSSFAELTTGSTQPTVLKAEALAAYKKFWDAFSEYETKTRRSSVEEYQTAREGLQSLYEKSEQSSVELRIRILTDAITKYKSTPNLPKPDINRPFTLINLAQSYVELAALERALGRNAESSEANTAALQTLKEIEDHHPDFDHITQALFLRAMILEANNNSDAALTIWKKLADTSRDKFSLYGNLVLGDKAFDSALPDKALEYYLSAQGILTKIEVKDRNPLDSVRVYYRIAWANFKSGKTTAALNAVAKVVDPDVISRATQYRQKILTDLGDLTAYCLFAQDNPQKTEAVLKSAMFRLIGAHAALTLMNQYISTKLPVKAAHVGEIATEEFPLAQEFPDILRLQAYSDELSNRKISRIEALEKLAMLLPAGSLWRHQNASKSNAILHMEELARSANEVIATEYYQQGLNTGNPRKFVMAANYFQNLLDDSPNTEKAARLRLNIANANYFAGNLSEADRGYAELISALKTPEDILMNAYYQRALTLDKIWRTEFEAAVRKSLDTATNTKIITQLSNLENAVEEHATRFPSQSRSIDLLIVAASANRDQNRFDQAGRFWQRVLLSNPSPGQRAIAIRGLVFNKIRAGRPADIIEMTTNFLKFEKADSLMKGLREELLGVLARAATDESSSLGKRGLSEEAGSTLLQLVSEFEDLPGREKFWRDGAYFLAISGNWARAQASAENFLKENYRQFDGDMKYLLARSHEYQLRFDRAATSYVGLASAHPRHPRAITSLERAEKLALADNNLLVAGQAAEALAAYPSQQTDTLKRLDAAIDYYMRAESYDKARRVGERRLKNSNTLAEKMKSELVIGKIRYASGDIQVAIDDLDTLSKQIDRARSNLGSYYGRLASETNMILGEHALQQFEKLRIDGVSGSSVPKVERKRRLFNDLNARLDKVVNIDLAEFSTKARFLIARSASRFADEISAIPSRQGEPATLRNQTRFNQNINRLRDMAQKYHGENILAKQRSPQGLLKNEWISRSAMALSNSPTVKGVVSRSVEADQLSTASGTDIPQQWSH